MDNQAATLTPPDGRPTGDHHQADHAHHDDHAHHIAENKRFGFWVYLMSDCILFASLFATYAVLMNGTAGGPAGKDIFELPLVFVETMFLLASSLTFGMGMIEFKKQNLAGVKKYLAMTFFLGLAFICIELYEFHVLIEEGYGPDRSAFLSGFFALVATHGLHVTFGLIWLATCYVQLSKNGLTQNMEMRLSCLSLFWHFLDIIWICVFTFVYLFGVLL